MMESRAWKGELRTGLPYLERADLFIESRGHGVLQRDLGPLKNVQKVNSFTRTLVSVADLVEQFGVVMFDRTGAYLSSCRGREALISKIGSYTGDRLYRFDQSSLAKHRAVHVR